MIDRPPSWLDPALMVLMGAFAFLAGSALAGLAQ